MKRIIVASMLVSVLAVAMPVMAFGGFHMPSSDIKVESENNATVTNTVNVSASTGSNGASGGTIVTGNAGAEADVLNMVNSNETTVKASCGRCSGDVKVESENNATVKNTVNVSASTGSNSVSGSRHHGSGALIITGDAGALGVVDNYVNSNVTRIRR